MVVQVLERWCLAMFGITITLADLTIDISNSTCGSEIDIATVGKLYLRYDGQPVVNNETLERVEGFRTSDCVILITNNKEHTELCISADSEDMLEWHMLCYKRFSLFYDYRYNRVECMDFTFMSECQMARIGYARFRPQRWAWDKTDRSKIFSVQFFTRYKAPTTTTTTTTVPPWHDNDYGDDYDTSDWEESIWWIMLPVFGILLCCCLTICKKKSSDNTGEGNTSRTIQTEIQGAWQRPIPIEEGTGARPSAPPSPPPYHTLLPDNRRLRINVPEHSATNYDSNLLDNSDKETPPPDYEYAITHSFPTKTVYDSNSERQINADTVLYVRTEAEAADAAFEDGGGEENRNSDVLQGSDTENRRNAMR